MTHSHTLSDYCIRELPRIQNFQPDDNAARVGLILSVKREILDPRCVALPQVCLNHYQKWKDNSNHHVFIGKLVIKIVVIAGKGKRVEPDNC